MGYVEKIMGDNEQAVYRTHLHFIVLLQRAIGWLFAFLVFLGLGLAWFLMENDKHRFYAGVITLGTLILPIYLIVRLWRQSPQREGVGKLLWRPILAGVLILATAVVMMLWPAVRLTGWVPVIVSLFPLFELIRIALDWMNERYIITNRRVMEIKGIINKHVRDSALEKVNDVDMKQSVVGRILGYGTVQIITGSDIGVNMFHRISNPVRFKRAMLNAKEELHTTEDLPRQARPAVEAAAPDLAVPAEKSIPDLIEELAELQRKGLITDEEFQAKKKELLSRL